MILDKSHVSVAKIMAQTKRSSNRKRYWGWIVGIILLLFPAAVIALWIPDGKSNPISFQTQPVGSGRLVVTVTATGNLAATNEVEIGSELSGIITRMTADCNDTVHRGQPLTYLDDAAYKAAVRKSRAEVKSAEAGHQEALATQKANEKQLQRYRHTHDLTNGKLPALDVLEQAEADLERSAAAVAAAAAAIDIARANLDSAETNLKKTVIYAPISGIVLSRDVEPGQTVAASLQAPVLYTLAEDLRHMELQVDVDEADVGSVREGQAAIFTVDAYPEHTFKAQITQVRYGADATDGVVTYKTVLSVDNPDLLLRPGMTATANIIVLETKDSLLVPNAALRFSPSKPAAGRRRSGSLLDSLLPRPRPPRGANKTSGEEGPGQNGRADGVWVLQENRPVLLAVEKVATDGAVTAVLSQTLQEGMDVIVNAISAIK